MTEYSLSILLHMQLVLEDANYYEIWVLNAGVFLHYYIGTFTLKAQCVGLSGL